MVYLNANKHMRALGINYFITNPMIKLHDHIIIVKNATVIEIEAIKILETVENY